MKELFVARHAESELNLENVLNGDPALAVGLTARGEEQARALGAAVGQVDLAAHTSFARTRSTAELAWPEAPRLEVPELDEIRFGRFEGTRFGDGYEAWARSAGPEDACPGGGESRVEAPRRYVKRLPAVARAPGGAARPRRPRRADPLPPRWPSAARLPRGSWSTFRPRSHTESTATSSARAIELLEAWAAAPEFAPE